MRGTDGEDVKIPYVGRITPARAGNRSWMIRKGVVVGDHPRACGEQSKNEHILRLAKGSPPRVRGTGRLRKPDIPVGGITPARAGNRNVKNVA